MKLFKLLSFLIITAAMAACSSDNEPEVSTAGEEMSARFQKLLIGENSNWLFPDGSDDNTRYAAVADPECAGKLAVEVIGDPSWSVDKRIYTLPGGYGNVAVRDAESEGVFLTMTFNVKNMRPLTLHFATLDYLRSLSNYSSRPVWAKKIVTCNDCGAVFPYAYLGKRMVDVEHDIWLYECPVCGSLNFTVDTGTI